MAASEGQEAQAETVRERLAEAAAAQRTELRNLAEAMAAQQAQLAKLLEH